MLETVEKSLLHSCTSAINRQGISLPLDPQSQGRRLLGIIESATHLFFYHSSTGQESDPILHLYDLAESCVFVKQSLLSALCLFFRSYLKKNSFSRSYGVILPSSFNIIISIALVYSTCPPESVQVHSLIQYKYKITHRKVFLREKILDSTIQYKIKYFFSVAFYNGFLILKEFSSMLALAYILESVLLWLDNPLPETLRLSATMFLTLFMVTHINRLNSDLF